MADNWNEAIIEEFRANNGRVGGRFEGHSLVLLHHRGARTGNERVNPLACQVLDDSAWAVFASKGGAPTNPDWFHNLTTNPEATIETGAATVPVRARVAEGEEREEHLGSAGEGDAGFRPLRVDDDAQDPGGCPRTQVTSLEWTPQGPCRIPEVQRQGS